MTRVFLIGLLAIIISTGIEIRGQLPQQERMKRRIEQSIRANTPRTDENPSTDVSADGVLPEPRPAVMNVDVQMTLSKAEHKTFAEAKAAEVKKVGGSAEVHVYDAGGHGYGLRPVAEFPVTTWPARAAEWMARRGLLRPNEKK